eukprot:scaffold517_cov255-Pinguiococcus_pyrenoidosus.AAC.36
MSVVVGQPFDTVKVRLQTDCKGLYNGAVECAMKLVGTEGWPSLFRGVLSPVLTTSLVNAIVFSSHAGYVRHVTQGKRQATASEQFLGGSLG